jgi:hydrogenase nickel incorporation protein HypA/HybF
MHEYTFARSLLRQVDQLRLEQRARRVVTVRVKIGEFSGIEPGLLQSAFGDLAIETPAGGARLEAQCVSLTIRCDDCGCESAVIRHRFECPQCASQSVQIISGDELLLESVTMEYAEP